MGSDKNVRHSDNGDKDLIMVTIFDTRGKFYYKIITVATFSRSIILKIGDQYLKLVVDNAMLMTKPARSVTQKLLKNRTNFEEKYAIKNQKICQFSSLS